LHEGEADTVTERRTNFEAWSGTLIDLAERIYRIVRGLPHHRLALITVSVGAAILAGPLWEPYLRAIIERTFALQIDVPTEPFYGVVLITLGLGYHLWMTAIASRETIASKTRDAEIEDRIRAHDTPIFSAFIEQAPENAFKNAMSSIVNDHSYTSVQSTMFLGAFYFLDTVANEFNDDIMREKAAALKMQIDKLSNFVANHFSVYGPLLAGDVLRFCMAPEWNIDRGGNPSRENCLAYSDLSGQLTPIVKATTAAYDDLIRTGHRRLL
jgi:hypothetical protein